MAKQNGAIVLLYVATAPDSLGTAWIRVGGQKGVDFGDTTDEIDLSDKISGRLGERIAGRAKASVKLDLNYDEADPAQDLIRAAYRQRKNILVQRFHRTNPDVLTGTAIEEATGLIVDLSESHPDQDASTMSMEVSLSNDWTPST